MGIFSSPATRFAENYRQTTTRKPKNTRDTLYIAASREDGIFQIDASGSEKLYDRCYMFSDVNYINYDLDQQENVLLAMASFLNSMTVDFKITVANEYIDMARLIDDIYSNKNKAAYPQIQDGMREWIKEKVVQANISDTNRVLYLTVTKRAGSAEEAKSYFLGLDVELTRLFHAMGSTIVPLSGEMRLEAIQRFFYDNRRESMGFDFSHQPMIDPVWDVIPVSVDEQDTHLVFNGDHYVAVMFAADFRASLDEKKILRQLTNMPYKVICTVDCAPVDKDVLMSMLETAHMNTESAIAKEIESKSSRGQLMAGISYAKERKKEELEAYTDQVDENNESCLLVSLMLVVTAPSEDELAQRVDHMTRIGKENGVALDLYNYYQLDAFNAALPIGARTVPFSRAFFTSSLVALQPFYAEDLMERGGLFMGINRTTKRPVFANRSNLLSPHGVVYAPTGAGKSFFIKETEISQTLLATDDDVFIIDPQNEFKDICLSYDGQFIDLLPQGGVYLNPMECPAAVLKGSDQEKNVFIAQTTEWACSFLEAIMSDMLFDQIHRALIETAVRSIYLEYFDNPVKQPTMKNLRDELMALERDASIIMERDRLYSMNAAIEPYCTGIYNMFAHESNVDITKRLVAFGMRNVSDKHWPAMMLTVMYFLGNRMEYNRNLQRVTNLIVDEAQIVCADPASSQMLLKSVVTYRKFGGRVTMVLQNFSRVLDNNALRDMFSNCGYKCFLSQNGIDIRNIAVISDLTEAEIRCLNEQVPGYGLMVWGNKKIQIDAGMSRKNLLYPLFSTSFREED